MHQGISVDEARAVWLDGWRHGWATRRRAVVDVYGGQPKWVSPGMVAVWRDGWRHGASGRRTADAIRWLYAGSPPPCPLTGAPCAGRIECQASRRDGTTN